MDISRFSAALLCCSVFLNIRVSGVEHPFQIPPNGQPEQLVGEVDYVAPTAMAFDSKNRPYLINTKEEETYGNLYVLEKGRWAKRSFLKKMKSVFPEMKDFPGKNFRKSSPGTMTIDADDNIYIVMTALIGGNDLRWLLLFSNNQGRSFQAIKLPDRSFLEQSTGHNMASGGPALGCLTLRKKSDAKWAAHHALDVYFPSVIKGKIKLGEAVRVTDDCFGISNHSGGASFAATLGSETHVVYAEIDRKIKGNPTYVTTIDRNTRTVKHREYLVNAPPITLSDVHATPVISVDSRGYLHVLAGSHGNHPFPYLRSSRPGRAEKWSDPVGQGKEQTYTTLVVDSDDAMHSVYREQGILKYQYKRAMAESWSDADSLVLPPAGHDGYTGFYQRLFIDRKDHVYLSFTFFELENGSEADYPRALAVLNRDRGRKWTLVETSDLERGIDR